MGKERRKTTTRRIQLKVFKQEQDGTCGAASLKMMFNFYGVKLSEKYIVNKLFKVQASAGVHPDIIAAAARKIGFTVFAKRNAKINDIKKFIKKRMPVMVEWFSVDAGHYSVVISITNRYIYLADPEGGVPSIRKIPIYVFKGVWFDYEDKYPTKDSEWTYQWMMAIIPRA